MLRQEGEWCGSLLCLGTIRNRQKAHCLIAHSLIGVGEIVLLPLDVLKIKRQ